MDASIQERMKKHIGTVKNTGARIYLVFRKIPDDPTNCLVVMGDSLPDQYFDNVYGLVMSREAQNTVDLFEVFGRHKFADGGNVLQTLHEKRFLVKMPVDMIQMEALPGIKTELSIINESIDGAGAATTATPATEPVIAPAASVSLEHPVSSLTAAQTMAPADPTQSPIDYAKQLLANAKLLEEQAKTMRKVAGTLDPKTKVKEAKPIGRPDSGLTAEQKREIRNEKRRNSYSEKKK